MLERKCENCDYYDSNIEQTGLCRRSALGPGGPQDFDWPRVAGSMDWCGDFAPKGTYEKLAKAIEDYENNLGEVELEDFPTSVAEEV